MLINADSILDLMWFSYRLPQLACTGRTQKNGVVSSLKPLIPHHSFVYALYKQG